MKMSDLDLLLPQPAPPGMTGRWATVSSVNPLRIRYDGELDPLAVPVLDLVGGLAVGSRVWTNLYNSQVYLVGKPGGPGVPVELGPGDINLVVTTGRYSQSQTAEATGVNNYPKAYAGLLEVFSNPGGSTPNNMIWQRYSPYGQYAVQGFYQRAYYNGTWYPWNLYEPSVTIPDTVTYTADPGWSIDSFYGAVSGKSVHIYVNFTRTGGTITVPADGNITNSTVLTLGAAFWPIQPIGLATGGAGVMAACYISSAGLMQVGAFLPGQTITNGRALSASGTWLRA
jgi:hypothetical protein